MYSAQYEVEVAWSGDQEVVEAFPAQGADEPFCDRVCPRRLGGGADDADVGAGEHGVERGGEFAVPVADQEPEPVGVLAEVHEQVAGLLGDPPAGGMGGDPACAVRGCRQVGPVRRGAGSRPAAWRIVQTVEAATWC